MIQVSVDGVLELNVTAAQAGVASFDPGSFGFYNYSQENVLYSAIEDDEADPVDPSVPAPSSLLLVVLGLSGVGAGRLRRT